MTGVPFQNVINARIVVPIFSMFLMMKIIAIIVDRLLIGKKVKRMLITPNKYDCQNYQKCMQNIAMELISNVGRSAIYIPRCGSCNAYNPKEGGE